MRVMKLQWSPINPPFKMPTDPPHSPSGSMISSSMLIHFWEARKNVKGGPCMFLEIEMLMIDEEGTLAQGFIGQNLRNQYEKELERGSIYTLTKFYASNSKVMYHVADQKLCSGPVMNIYLWDEAAENFCLKFDACAATPTVLLITTVNPKRLGGKLRLSSMSYSRVFLDEEVDSPKEYLTCSQVRFSLQTYMHSTKYILITCPLNNYRVAMSVYDNEEQFTFIILRDAGKEFTGRKAIELIDTYVEENGGDGTELEVPLPQCFIDTKGQTKKFRIKVAHYNFTSTRLSLTATRIVSSAVLLPKNPPLNTPPIPLSTTQNSRAATEVEISDVAESSGGGSPYANDRPTSATDDQKKPKRIKRCG
uniref:Replication factor A C-terminal domain-containing protein n=1 Tax=Brassica campestris TaxID=3711 RepID=M4E9W0_BRACM